MSSSDDESTKEYKRWRDYANVLFLALTALFAGASFIGTTDPWRIFAILSACSGVVGIVLVVCWYAREYKIQIGGKPALLLWASGLMGAQAVLLIMRMIFLGYNSLLGS